MKLRLWAGAFLNYLFNEVLTHIPVHVMRLGFLRLFNKKIHQSTKILMHTRLLNFWELETAERVVINQHCLLDCRRFNISIGNDSDIGPYTRIWTLGHDTEAPDHAVSGGPVIIGHHVWIASGVTILPNVIIGNGAVVASASVVTKAVEDLSIVGGNPARKIRSRKNDLGYQLLFNPILE